MSRRWELDALRGLMLVLMTVTHLPTRLSEPLGQPLGFVSAAEGFVLLSAYMAGLVYSRVACKKGLAAMRQALWRRTRKVYVWHTATLLFLFTVVAAVGVLADEPAVTDLMSFYLDHPLTALGTGLLLIYTPPLLDILPMYILFMLASPWLLAHALRRGWGLILALSLAAWVLAQFGLGGWVYQAAVALAGPYVPFQETGSFATFAWQLLWVLGLWMGASHGAGVALPRRLPGWAVALAALLALTGLLWRHHEGQAPFGADVALNLLFDKWLLGPLRLLNLAALVVLLIRFGPWLKARVLRLRWLEALGAASLPVFCAHLVIVLLALALLGANPLAHAWWVDAALLGGCFSALYAVARRAQRRAPPSHGRRLMARRRWCRCRRQRRQQMRANHRLPQLVARRIQMQPVGQKQLGPGLALGVEHGAEDVDVADILERFGVAGNQGVGLPGFGQQGQARRAGLDGNVVDARARQLGAHALHEAGKAGQHLGGRAALGQVVVARVEQHLPRLVLGHQLARQRAAVGQRRAAKAALQQHRLGAEILRQLRPQPNRRAADKQHAAAGRALRLVGTGKSGQAGLPARLCLCLRRRHHRRLGGHEFGQLLRLQRWRSSGQQRRQRQQGRHRAPERVGADKGFEGEHPGKFTIGRRLVAFAGPWVEGESGHPPGCRPMLQFYEQVCQLSPGCWQMYYPVFALQP